MGRNDTKRSATESRSIAKGADLSPELDELKRLRKELHLQKESLDATEEILLKLQNLHKVMMHNFPGGTICVLNKDLESAPLGIMCQPGSNGNNERTQTKPPPFDEITLAQLKRAFDGETVNCHVHTRGMFFHVTAIPLADHRNEINEVLCVMQDFTEQKKLEEHLRQSLDKEKELGELKSRFVTMASHEFRTPLTMILSSTFLLENAPAENFEAEKRVHTTRIKRAVNNLTLILNEFLSLEKLEQNKVELVPADINLPEFIQDTLSEMEILKREKQIIEYHHSGDQWIVKIDHHLLWSIVTNLISNAMKYSDTGDRIEITTEIMPASIKLTVKDQGIGIPDDEHQFIFGRFFRARNAVNIDGTGLGLHIIQKYIHLLSGTISFESQLDVGTTFKVNLPATAGVSLSPKTRS